MLFQIIDAKKKCLGYYADDKLVLGEDVPNNLKQTWAYSPSLRDRHDVKYASLYCGGKSLDDVCPAHLAEQWEHVSDRLKAFFRSFMEAKISLDDNCFFELVPHLFLSKYYDIRNQITEYVFENYDRPENYWFLRDLTKMLLEISEQRLHIDYSTMKDSMHSLEARNLVKRIKRTSPYCKYNIFGSKTGRLTTQKDTFPILTFDKKYRNILKPANDMFIELDFNAAELRTLLSLVDREQPEGDLHDWNVTNVFHGLCTRDEAKKRIFAWLYNPASSDYHCEKFYNRQNIKENFWTGTEVITPFGRTISSDEDHCVSYLIQSTCVDNTLRQMIRIWKLLEGRQSFVAFTMHDSVVIDFSRGDRDLFREMVEEFADTDLGNFVVNVSVGDNFGEMRKL